MDITNTWKQKHQTFQVTRRALDAHVLLDVAALLFHPCSLCLAEKWKALKTRALFKYFFPYSGVPPWQGAKCCQAAIHWYQQIPYLFIIDLDSWSGRWLPAPSASSPKTSRIVSSVSPSVLCLQHLHLAMNLRPFVLQGSHPYSNEGCSSNSTFTVDSLKTSKTHPAVQVEVAKKINSTKSRLEKGWLFLTTL